MDPLVAKAAGALARQLAAPVGGRMRDAVLGDRADRALQEVCRTAMQRAAAEAGDGDAAHALSLLERLLRDRPPDGVPSLVAADAPDERTLAGWRHDAEEAGLDPDTFPVSFDALVTRLLRLIPEELTRAAGRPDSPLFGEVVLANLERLGANVAAVSTHGMAMLVPLSAALKESLDRSYSACRLAGRAFVTPDLLLAIAPNPAVTTCLDDVQTGLAAELTGRLRRYLTAVDTGPFHPFEWPERADVRRACQLAWATRTPAVTELLLLRGVLETPTNTSRQLAAWLGPRFDDLRDHARTRTRAPVAPPGTPGKIFGS